MKEFQHKNCGGILKNYVSPTKLVLGTMRGGSATKVMEVNTPEEYVVCDKCKIGGVLVG